MTPFEILGLVLAVTSGVGWVNKRFLGLPSSVGLLAAGLLAASGLFAFDHAWPGHAGAQGLSDLVARFDFSKVLMGFLLAYLLFAGALHTDAAELARFPVSIGVLSTVGVVISTAVIAAGMWAVARLLGVPLPAAWAAVFGALISPTDPVAVLAALRGDDASGKVRSLMEGESLFNDGVGVVVFGAALSVALGGAPGPGPLAGQLLLEVAAGALLGGAAGAGRAAAHARHRRLERGGGAEPGPGHGRLRPGGTPARERAYRRRGGGAGDRDAGRTGGHERPHRAIHPRLRGAGG